MIRQIAFVLMSVLFLGTLAPAADADAAGGAAGQALEQAGSGSLDLVTRSRQLKPEGDGCQIVYRTVRWEASKTAVIVCDMWDADEQPDVAARIAELAQPVNDLVEAARRRGVLIIHAPSGVMVHYEGKAPRELVAGAPLPSSLKEWTARDPRCEPSLPVDPSAGQEPPEPNRAATRQIEAIAIANGDAVGDDARVVGLLDRRGIENVILVGVHTNGRLLGGPLGIRQLVAHGKNVVLVRDLTDARLPSDPTDGGRRARAAERIIEHIEKYACPTVTSTDLLGRPTFRFSDDRRPHVAVIVSDDHYRADKTLPDFAQTLREQYGWYCTVLHGQGKADIPHTEELEAADCMVLFVRRLGLPREQLDRIRAYVASRRPLVALRTATHAFAAKYNPPPDYRPAPGTDEWPSFGAEILGDNYHGHGRNTLGSDIAIVPEAADHPILAGVEPQRWHSTGSMYYLSPIAEDATLLMTASSGDRTEPLTWIRTADGRRMFFTGLGHWDDFRVPAMRRLLANGIAWAMEAPPAED